MSRAFLLLLVPSVLCAENFFGTEKFFPNDEIEIFSDEAKGYSIDRIENYPNRNEPVRSFLKNYNSLRPVAILVDDTAESITSATEFMKEVFNLAPSAERITFFVGKFNSTGASSLVEFVGSDLEKFHEILSQQPQEEKSELGHKYFTGSLCIYATLKAATTLPQDGAILVFIDRKTSDDDLASHVSLIRHKNIKVYVVWGGPSPTKTNEERLLKELCQYSGGLFLNNGIKYLSGYNYRQFISNNNNTNMNTSTILSKTNLTEDITFTFPIDSEVTCIQAIITPSTTQGTLTPPTGEHVDIQNNDSITSYGTGSFGITERGYRVVYLDATQGVGVWNFNVRASTTPVPCNLTVFVCSRLTAQAYFLRESTGHTEDETRKKILKLDLTGRLREVNNISFIDDKGNFITNDFKFDLMKDLLVMENDNHNKAIDIEVSNVPNKPFQVYVQGTDTKGNQFSRLTYVNDRSYGNIFPQPILTIDVGLGSELITTGGRSSTITFEVTNLRNVAVDASFYCKDDKSILGSMQPYRRVISPQETAIVTLILTTRYGVYQDSITFTATVGSDYVEKKLIVDVGTQPQLSGDTTPPSLDYSYLSDCSKVIFSSCDQGTWTIEAKARDTGSGLLQLTSIPKGLYFQDGFTTGTKEEVTGTYSDTCCNADLQLIAIDRANNRRTVTPNAYRAMWGPGQIAAIVLGIILFILLIILIVYLVRRCIKKREMYNLPTYRGGGI